MADDRKEEYLRRALECARFGQTVPDAKAREIFAAMAKTWIKMAAELNRTKKGQP
jgi:hypothetical protein